jgi:hypothetical protein
MVTPDATPDDMAAELHVTRRPRPHQIVAWVVFVALVATMINSVVRASLYSEDPVVFHPEPWPYSIPCQTAVEQYKTGFWDAESVDFWQAQLTLSRCYEKI